MAAARQSGPGSAGRTSGSPTSSRRSPTQAAVWAREHQPIVVGAVAAVARHRRSSCSSCRERRAARAELRVRRLPGRRTDVFQGGKYPEAAAGFAPSLRSCPGTPFGRLARLYRGHALARQGDAAAAAVAYGEYLAIDPETAYLRQEALVGLGRAKEVAGDATGALEAYTQAAALEGPFRTDAAPLRGASPRGRRPRRRGAGDLPAPAQGGARSRRAEPSSGRRSRPPSRPPTPATPPRPLGPTSDKVRYVNFGPRRIPGYAAGGASSSPGVPHR